MSTSSDKIPIARRFSRANPDPNEGGAPELRFIEPEVPKIPAVAVPVAAIPHLAPVEWGTEGESMVFFSPPFGPDFLIASHLTIPVQITHRLGNVAFKSTYGIPPEVKVRFCKTVAEVLGKTSETEKENAMEFPRGVITYSGVSFPLDKFLGIALKHFGVPSYQIYMNTYRAFFGRSELRSMPVDQ